MLETFMQLGREKDKKSEKDCFEGRGRKKKKYFKCFTMKHCSLSELN